MRPYLRYLYVGIPVLVAVSIVLSILAFLQLRSGGNAGGTASTDYIHNRPTRVTLLPAPTTVPPSDLVVSDVSKWGTYRMPFFSPDSTRFFAYSEQGLVVGNADGTDLNVLDPGGQNAAWLDPTSIVVVHSDETVSSPEQRLPLYLFTLDGAPPRLVGYTDSAFRLLEFTADKRLAVSDGGVLHVISDLQSPDPIDTPYSDVQLDRDQSLNPPFLISPDGSKVATIQRQELTLHDLVSGKSQLLTDRLDYRRWKPFSWSPDGRFLAYTEVWTDGIPQTFAFDISSGELHLLFKGQDRGTFGFLNWTPDGQWLVFAFYSVGPGADATGTYQAFNTYSGETRTLFTGGSSLILSGDGTRLSFSVLQGEPTDVGAYVAQINY